MRYTIDVLTGPEQQRRALRDDVAEGLTSTPKHIPSKWFYDATGSQLFDDITRLPEYYLTRAERAILDRESGAIARAAGADTLIEIGSGTSTKTRLLLDAMAARRYVPFDVSEETLRASAESIAGAYPGVEVHAVAGDFELHMGALPSGGRRLLIFLGSTIGNFEPATRKQFFNEVAAGLTDGDSFLMGADLVKDVSRITAAYNDADGVTAAFNKNVLEVINRELGADFDPALFEHVARYDTDNEWVELCLQAKSAQEVTVSYLDLRVSFDAGERMRTEISAKFRLEGLAAELSATGLAVERTWTDPRGDFALVLAFRR